MGTRPVLAPGRKGGSRREREPVPWSKARSGMGRPAEARERARCAWCGVAAIDQIEVTGARIKPFVVVVCSRHSVWIRKLATPRQLRRQPPAWAG